MTAKVDRDTIGGAAAALRDARERAGLSIRQLAARSGLSPATILEAEAGGDPRRSTLVKCLSALSSLAPRSLLDRVPLMPTTSDGAWTFIRDVLGFSIRRVRFEVDIASDGSRSTILTADGVVPVAGPLDDAATSRLVQLLFRGSPAARVAAASGERRIEDGAYTHAFRLTARGVLSYTRTQHQGQVPAGMGAPGNLALSAPFPEGASFAIEHAIEALELSVRMPKALWPESPRPGAWTDLQTVTPEEPDSLPFLHPSARLVASPRSRTLSLSVERPEFGLYYGIGWGGAPKAEPDPAPRAARSGGTTCAPATAIRLCREGAGLSQRQLAARIDVSPATIALAERGQDVRRSHLLRLLDALPGLEPESLLQAPESTEPMTRREAWEHQRLLLGIEADEERKTLVITPEGDAHAICETLRLRRVRPSGRELRVRYSSVQALGRRLPTVLKTIEDAVAAKVGDSGLKARVVARRQGRLIHEITVPAHLAQVGASYSRRLFNAGFFDPAPATDAAPRYDGAAIVPFHPVRRLFLSITLPAGRWPERAWFGVHPRMMLEGPLAEADVSDVLHAEGLETRLDAATRTIELSVAWPLVGFMYDVFWTLG